MDRTQLLYGMTAMGLAGSLNLNDLASAQDPHGRISDCTPVTLQTAVLRLKTISRSMNSSEKIRDLLKDEPAA